MHAGIRARALLRPGAAYISADGRVGALAAVCEVRASVNALGCLPGVCHVARVFVCAWGLGCSISLCCVASRDADVCRNSMEFRGKTPRGSTTAGNPGTFIRKYEMALKNIAPLGTDTTPRKLCFENNERTCAVRKKYQIHEACQIGKIRCFCVCQPVRERT